jgi:hypothetical protein
MVAYDFAAALVDYLKTKRLVAIVSLVEGGMCEGTFMLQAKGDVN